MTVYLLGAGASRHVGYPLASRMATELFAWMLKSPANPSYRSAAEGLLERFGSKPNIEDVITDLQEQIMTLGSGGLEDRIKRVPLIQWRCRLVNAVRDWFREIRAGPAPGYAIFANSIVQPGDVVVTFNYDDSLEHELRLAGKWDIHRGYGFPDSNGERSPTLVLKLHGSINWMALMFGGLTSGTATFDVGCSLGSGPRIQDVDLGFLGYEAIPELQLPSGAALPALIMPGRKKEFFYDTSLGQEWGGFWHSLWATAGDAIRYKNTGELVVCGYNLLPVDQHARKLILRAPDKNILVTIVSGDQSDRIAEEFRQNGFNNVHSEQNQRFEDWVKKKARNFAA